jgi:hypothetical protein
MTSRGGSSMRQLYPTPAHPVLLPLAIVLPAAAALGAGPNRCGPNGETKARLRRR